MLLPHLQTAVFQHRVQLLVYNECFHTSICVNMPEYGESHCHSLINNCRCCMKRALASVNTVSYTCYIKVNVSQYVYYIKNDNIQIGSSCSLFLYFYGSSIMVSECHRGHIACRPPSTGRLTPVINVAASDARKAIA